MVRIRDADLRISAVADFATDHETGDAGQIGLERQHLQIDHQADVIVERIRDTGRRRHWCGLRVGAGGALDAAFDIAGRLKIFIELVAVARAQLPRQPRGVFAHEVQNAGLAPRLRQPPGVILHIAIAEQAFEHVARVGGYRQWHCRARPGNAVGIGAGIADVATAQQAGRIDTHLQRRQLRRLAQIAGKNLIHRDRAADIAAFGLVNMRAGQERRTRPAMPGRAVPQRRSHWMTQPGDHRNAVMQRRQWCQNSGQRLSRQIACRSRTERVHHHAVGGVKHGQAPGAMAGIHGAGGGRHGFEHGQGERSAEPTQDGAARQGLAGNDHRASLIVAPDARHRGLCASESRRFAQCPGSRCECDNRRLLRCGRSRGWPGGPARQCRGRAHRSSTVR